MRHNIPPNASIDTLLDAMQLTPHCMVTTWKLLPSIKEGWKNKEKPIKKKEKQMKKLSSKIKVAGIDRILTP